MHYPRIRDLREDADMTQQQVADAIFLHKTTYVRYKSGVREVPFQVAIALAKFYHVSLDYLAGLTNCMEPPEPVE